MVKKLKTAGSVGSIRVQRSLAACRALLFCDDQWPLPSYSSRSRADMTGKSLRRLAAGFLALDFGFDAGDRAPELIACVQGLD